MQDPTSAGRPRPPRRAAGLSSLQSALLPPSPHQLPSTFMRECLYRGDGALRASGHSSSTSALSIDKIIRADDKTSHRLHYEHMYCRVASKRDMPLCAHTEVRKNTIALRISTCATYWSRTGIRAQNLHSRLVNRDTAGLEAKVSLSSPSKHLFVGVL